LTMAQIFIVVLTGRYVVIFLLRGAEHSRTLRQLN
jgi:hypothetical protein